MSFGPFCTKRNNESRVHLRHSRRTRGFTWLIFSLYKPFFGHVTTAGIDWGGRSGLHAVHSSPGLRRLQLLHAELPQRSAHRRRRCLRARSPAEPARRAENGGGGVSTVWPVHWIFGLAFWLKQCGFSILDPPKVVYICLAEGSTAPSRVKPLVVKMWFVS